MQAEIFWKLIIVNVNDRPILYELDEGERLKNRFKRAKNRKNLTTKYKQHKRKSSTPKKSGPRKTSNKRSDVNLDFENQIIFTNNQCDFLGPSKNKIQLSESEPVAFEFPSDSQNPLNRESFLDLFNENFFNFDF